MTETATTTSWTEEEQAWFDLIDPWITQWIEKGWVIETGWAGRPVMHSPLRPVGVADARFDAARVEKLVRFGLLVPQLEGRWRGQPFRFFDWQLRWLIGPVFGWVHSATELRLRVVSETWWEEPRKNGKSGICRVVGLYLFAADGEAAPEVYSAASDRSQAGIIFRGARDMVLGSKALRKRIRPLRNMLEHRTNGGVFRALSSDGGRQHGLNVHGGLVDEVHVHKNPDVIEALETGVGARLQPLIVKITTPDDGSGKGPYEVNRERVESLASGSIVDPTTYVVVFAADEKAEGFDPFSLDSIRLANPGCGWTVTEEYLLKAAAKASTSPPALNSYLRLHLGIRTRQTTRWLPLAKWDAAAGMVTDAEWRDRVVWGGLDLSSTTDLTSFVLIAPNADGEGYMVRPMFWLPEEQAEQLEAKTRVPYARWAKKGLLHLTEGNVVDYAQMRADIKAEVDLLGCMVAEIGFDPWNAAETVQELENDGFVMVPIRQGYASLSSPAKELERLVMGSTPERPLFRHGGHEVLRWNADCVEVRTDEGGNIKPVKPDRVASTKRIDGIAASVNALARAMLRKPPKTRRVVGY